MRVGPQRGPERSYGSGFHFVLPWMHQMYRLPMGTQVLELTNYPTTAALASRQEKAAHIQNSPTDSSWMWMYRCSTDCRPVPGFHHDRPRHSLPEDNGIMPKAEPILKTTLGELSHGRVLQQPPLRVKSESRQGDLESRTRSNRSWCAISGTVTKCRRTSRRKS